MTVTFCRVRPAESTSELFAATRRREGTTTLELAGIREDDQAGCLAGGDTRIGKTYQLGGSKYGKGGLAGAFITGSDLKVGVGSAHGWQPVGASFKITSVRGPWVRSLDGKPASEVYAEMFG